MVIMFIVNKSVNAPSFTYDIAYKFHTFFVNLGKRFMIVRQFLQCLGNCMLWAQVRQSIQNFIKPRFDASLKFVSTD
jgi:hypothetical protein